MGEFYAWLGEKKSARIRLAVMDMWKPFRLATAAHAPQAAILFDKFHLVREVWDLRRVLEGMSRQLYIQCVMMKELVRIPKPYYRRPEFVPPRAKRNRYYY